MHEVDGLDDLQIRSLAAPLATAQIDALAELLIGCVEGGASVSFLHPLSRERAVAFWDRVGERVAQGQVELLVALRQGRILGTAQLVLDMPENQPHRADVAKVLVCRTARRQGVGQALMLAIEARALAAGRTLLVLDTVSGEAGERLYERLGWVRVGRVPAYALFPDGRPCDTTIFYKDLPRSLPHRPASRLDPAGA